MPAHDEVTVDLSNYKDRVGQRITPGRYPVLVQDAEVDTARSGNTMINLWLKVATGEFEGATVVDRLVLTEKSLFRVVGFMQAIGLPTPNKKLKLNVRQFVGRQLEIDVEDDEPYNGRVKSVVRGYLRSERRAGGGNGQADVADLTGLDEFAPYPNPAADQAQSNGLEPDPEPMPRGDAVEEVNSRLADQRETPDLEEAAGVTTEIDLDELDL